jgi:cob(I)alamin adenosyltransferase
MTDETADNSQWREKMARRKAVQDAEVASKTIEKGLLMVHTGPGKGKTTAAMGLALRMLGRNRPVAIVQFIKGAWSTGERFAFERFGDLLTWHSMGEGFTWETQDRARDIAACRRAWAEAGTQMARAELSLLILDELCIALRYGYLEVDEVVPALQSRRGDLHVVVTGRNAPAALLDAADLITEMQATRHPFKAGVKAQEGIEF